jgi:hypothetical protein
MQTVYIGDILINDVMLGSQRMDDVLTYNKQIVQNPVTGGLVLELNSQYNSYPLTGDTWFDVSGNGYNFKMTGSATFTPANGFDFNGVNQYFWATSSLGTQLTGDVFNSLTIFVDQYKDDNTSEGALFCGWQDSGSVFKFLTEVNANETIETAIKAAGVQGGDSTGTIATGTREIIGLLCSGSTQYRLNNNVILSGSSVVTGNWTTDNPPYTIGARLNAPTQSTNHYNGKIKAVLLYKRALTPSERTSVYNYLLSI